MKRLVIAAVAAAALGGNAFAQEPSAGRLQFARLSALPAFGQSTGVGAAALARRREETASQAVRPYAVNDGAPHYQAMYPSGHGK
jgi:hypothetical protein